MILLRTDWRYVFIKQSFTVFGKPVTLFDNEPRTLVRLYGQMFACSVVYYLCLTTALVLPITLGSVISAGDHSAHAMLIKSSPYIEYMMLPATLISIPLILLGGTLCIALCGAIVMTMIGIVFFMIRWIIDQVLQYYRHKGYNFDDDCIFYPTTAKQTIYWLD